MSRVGQASRENRTAQVVEIVLVFLVAFAVVAAGWRVVGLNPLARQGVVWIANVAMLTMIWIGLRLRGQGWAHFGLRLRFSGWLSVLRTVGQSLAVLVFALIAFVAGSVVGVNLAGAQQAADMSGYDYLQGNLPMLLLALAAVYVVSSFGEEVIYRGFLINRIVEMGHGARVAWAAAVAISAVVFGLIHFDWGLMGVIQTTFMGLALAVSYLVTKRNLWPLVLAHAYLDTVLLVQVYVGPPGPGSG
jgi:membrane protease YdiL (CAAX protease family)